MTKKLTQKRKIPMSIPINAGSVVLYKTKDDKFSIYIYVKPATSDSSKIVQMPSMHLVGSPKSFTTANSKLSIFWLQIGDAVVVDGKQGYVNAVYFDGVNNMVDILHADSTLISMTFEDASANITLSSADCSNFPGYENALDVIKTALSKVR